MFAVLLHELLGEKRRKGRANQATGYQPAEAGHHRYQRVRGPDSRLPAYRDAGTAAQRPIKHSDTGT